MAVGAIAIVGMMFFTLARDPTTQRLRDRWGQKDRDSQK